MTVVPCLSFILTCDFINALTYMPLYMMLKEVGEECQDLLHIHYYALTASHRL